MVHSKQVYTLTKNSKIIMKLENSKSISVSSKMFLDEIADLHHRDILEAGLKMDYTPQHKIIYTFKANKKNKMYNAHNVASVQIIINHQNKEENLDNMMVLDELINDCKDIVAYKTCKDLFEVGVVQGFVAQGYSIGTYFSPKLTIGLSNLDLNNQYNPMDVMYNPDNENNFLIFEDIENIDVDNSFGNQYVYK